MRRHERCRRRDCAATGDRAAPQAGCDLHLVLLTVWESGSAAYTGPENWHYRRGQRDAGKPEARHEFEVIDIFDGRKTWSAWRRPDGIPTTLGGLPIEDDEVWPPDALDGMEPDEEHFHEVQCTLVRDRGRSGKRPMARAL